MLKTFVLTIFLPIFGVILSYIFLKEVITTKVFISLVAIVAGIYFVKKGGQKKSFKF